jgi:hypothetical protein
MTAPPVDAERLRFGWPPREVHFNAKRARRTARLEARFHRANLRIVESPSMLKLAAQRPRAIFQEVRMTPMQHPDEDTGPLWAWPQTLFGKCALAAAGGLGAALLLVGLFAR